VLFCRFSRSCWFEDVGPRGFLGGPEVRNQFQEVKSEGWKQRLEGLVFQGPRGLIMMELNQARNARPQCSKHYTSGSKKRLSPI
jgi:hypothetical protein